LRFLVNRMAVRQTRRTGLARGIESTARRHVGESMLGFVGVMFSSRRGSGRRIASARVALALAFSTLALGACAPAVGSGVLVAVVAIGALTSHCYDYIDVTVYDAQGRRTCGAIVTATNGGDEFELKSCYYAPLTDGHWTIRARLPGLPDAVSVVDVEHANDCTRHVQSMELTLSVPGSAPPTAPPFLGAPAPPALPPPPAPSSPSPSARPPPASSAPPVPAAPATVAPPPASGAPASSSTPPSVGVFPDQGSRPSQPK
jgi:hypothetical protein